MRDLSGIYKESKHSFYLFSTQGLLISDVSCRHHSPVLALSWFQSYQSHLRGHFAGFSFSLHRYARANIYPFDR